MKTYKIFKTIYRALNILVILMMTLNAPLSVFAYTTTDKPDYIPGEVVTIKGDNSDGDFYQVGVPVDVVVTGPTVDDHYYCTSEPALEDGSWSCTVTLSEDPLIAVGYYSYVTMQNGVVIEEGSFTDAAPPSNQQLWQCDPPSVFDPSDYTCVSSGNTGWVSGNNDGPFYEGDTVPYRTRFQNLISGNEYNITIEWDTTKSSKHAIDYLKTFNATISAADPCVSLNGLPAGLCEGDPSTFPIPEDTFMQDDSQWIGEQDPGEFTMFGGTINSLSPYNVPSDYNGDTKTSITLSFTANSSDVVLAWGGHIAERADWGLNNSAVFITGSPYHMRIIKFGDYNVGNMDRSLSAEAVIYPAHVTIIKEADPQGEKLFDFTGDLGPFQLKDNGTDPNEIKFEIVDFKNYTITESVPSGWELMEIVCAPLADVVSTTIPSAVIDVDEADDITCYFRNKLQTGNIIIEKFTDPSGSSQEFEFNPSWTETNFFLSDGEWVDSGQLMAGTYSVAEIVPEGWELSEATCNDGESTVDNILLQAGETVTCTFSNYRNAMDLTVSKDATASFGRTYDWMIDKEVDKTLAEIAAGGSALFNYTVTVTPNGYTDSMWALSGTIRVTNPNDWQAVIADVTDVYPGGVCTVVGGEDVEVPAGGYVDLPYSCTFAAKPMYTGTNTATATWDAAMYHTPNGSAEGTAAVTFNMTGETNRTITVVDDKTDPMNPVELGEADYYVGPFEFTYSLSKSGVAGKCTTYTNTAMIEELPSEWDEQDVEVCVGVDLAVSKDATASFGRTYDWTIDKAVDKTLVEIAAGGSALFNYTVTVTPNGYTDSMWALSGTIRVTNPNDWQAVIADVTDVYPGGVCTVVGGEDVEVPAGGYVDLPYSCTFAAKPMYTGTNTATATWDAAMYHTPNGSAEGTAAVTFNMTGETNRTITVVDDKTDPMNPVELGEADYYVGPFEFTYSLSKSGVAGKCTTYTNTAMIEELPSEWDEQDVEVCVGLDLTVTKTAAGTYDRSYLWDIMKDVDKTYVEAMVGDVITFNYTVKVMQTGFDDSNWSLTGKITVANPNDWQDIVATVTDLYLGGVCTVVGGVNVTVPKGSFVELDYSCTFADEPSYTGTNTATATWDAAAYFTPTGTASGTAEASFTKVGEINKTINVTDSYAGDLGSVTATDESPWAEATFTYSRDITAEFAPACMTYDNTATIVETEQSDDASVQICTKYWAFTPGFWKNHTADTRNGHDAWKYTNYSTGDMLVDEFELGVLVGLSPKGTGKYFEELNLLDALRFKGGSGLTGAGEILLRAGVASLLNASFHEKMHGTHEGYFPFSTTEIKTKINAVLATGDTSAMLALAAELDGYNNGWHTIDWSWDPLVPLP